MITDQLKTLAKSQKIRTTIRIYGSFFVCVLAFATMMDGFTGTFQIYPGFWGGFWAEFHGVNLGMLEFIGATLLWPRSSCR